MCLLASLLHAASAPARIQFGGPATNGEDRLALTARDCPLGELLTRLCARLQCDLYLDPGLTNLVTVTIDPQDTEKGLQRMLSAFDYMLVWKTELDPKGRRKDRIAGIRVYRAGHARDAVLVTTPEKEQTIPLSAGPPLAEAEIAALGKKAVDRNDPEGACRAAETLAANASPSALKALFAALPLWDDAAELADPVSRAALAVAERAAAPALLKEYLAAIHESVELASRYALSRMADAAVMGQIEKAYEEAGDEDEKEKIETLIGAVCCTDAEPELIRLAGSPDRPLQSPLQWAALRALGNMGTAPATDCLLQRLETGKAEDRVELGDLVENVSASPVSVSALRYAALGNKRYASEVVRLAAIRALVRFADGQTRETLERLSADPSEAIRQEAARTLKEGTF